MKAKKGKRAELSDLRLILQHGQKNASKLVLFVAEELLWQPLKENKHGAIWCCLYNQFSMKYFTLNGCGDLDSVDRACEFRDYATTRVTFLRMPHQGINQATEEDAFLRAAILLSRTNRLTCVHTYTYKYESLFRSEAH